MEVIFRSLSNADFYNIYKPVGSESTGGGQTYIDFPITRVPIEKWKFFFRDIRGVETNTANPEVGQISWNVPLKSIGFEDSEQYVKIYRRRETTISIAAQTLNRRNSNRVQAWLPINGFPEPQDPTNRHSCPRSLTVFFLRNEKDLFAGWILPETDEGSDLSGIPEIKDFFKDMYRRDKLNESACGYEKLQKLKTSGENTTKTTENSQYFLAESFLEEDVFDGEDFSDQDESEVKQHLVKYRQRNRKIIKALKRLYGGKCQISGIEKTFMLPNGQYYSEAHHLIPLGKGGSDTPNNIIIICPKIHRMLHYCPVETIDFSKLQDNRLMINIDGKEYTIVYNSHHSELIKKLIE